MQPFVLANAPALPPRAAEGGAAAPDEGGPWGRPQSTLWNAHAPLHRLLQKQKAPLIRVPPHRLPIATGEGLGMRIFQVQPCILATAPASLRRAAEHPALSPAVPCILATTPAFPSPAQRRGAVSAASPPSGSGADVDRSFRGFPYAGDHAPRLERAVSAGCGHDAWRRFHAALPGIRSRTNASGRLKLAYRRFVSTLHPDRHGDDPISQHLARISSPGRCVSRSRSVSIRTWPPAGGEHAALDRPQWRLSAVDGRAGADAGGG